MQTAARAPFVFVFSGDSIGGKTRRDVGVLGREIVVNARKRLGSTERNICNKIFVLILFRINS